MAALYSVFDTQAYIQHLARDTLIIYFLEFVYLADWITAYAILALHVVCHKLGNKGEPGR